MISSTSRYSLSLGQYDTIKTAECTDVQRKVIDTLHKERKLKKVTAKEIGCSLWAGSKVNQSSDNHNHEWLIHYLIYN